VIVLSLSARADLIFISEEAAPDEPDRRSHAGEIGAHGEPRRGIDEIEGDDQHAHQDQRHYETYCQRSVYAITLAQDQVEGDDQGAERGSGSETRRRCPLDSVGWELLENGPRP
jgi:hypothetical protein